MFNQMKEDKDWQMVMKQSAERMNRKKVIKYKKIWH